MAGYRDESAVLRERIDQLELSLAKTTGRAMLLEDERDALSRELDALTDDPRALARRRSRNKLSKLPFRVFRLVGLLMMTVGLLPLVLMALAVAVNEPVAGLACSVVPALIVAGTLAFKLPDLVTWLQVREEEARARREAAARYRAKVRVEVPSGESEVREPVVGREEDARRVRLK